MDKSCKVCKYRHEEINSIGSRCAACLSNASLPNFVKTSKRGPGRPPKPDKKIHCSVKLPPWLIDWMDEQFESRARLIETSMRYTYGVKKPEVEK